jgi:CBS domain-containing protein
MQVKQAMSGEVKVISPDQTIREAARLMAELDCGCLPVGEDDKLVGMVTDRDIAIRAVAAGKSAKTPVREIMSAGVMYCFEEAGLDEVAQNMAEIQVRRLPVVNQDKRLVGILSLGDMALTADGGHVANALCGISAPGGEHSQ